MASDLMLLGLAETREALATAKADLVAKEKEIAGWRFLAQRLTEALIVHRGTLGTPYSHVRLSQREIIALLGEALKRLRNQEEATQS